MCISDVKLRLNLLKYPVVGLADLSNANQLSIDFFCIKLEITVYYLYGSIPSKIVDHFVVKP